MYNQYSQYIAMQNYGPARRTNSIPVEDGRNSYTGNMVANARPGTRTCGDEPPMEVDSDCESLDARSLKARIEEHDRKIASLKAITDSEDYRQQSIADDVTRRGLDTGTNTQGQLNDREMDELLAQLDAEIKEPRDSNTVNPHPLPALPTQRPNPTPGPNPLAVAGATAAVSQANAAAGMPQDINDAFAKIHSYYESMGTTLEAQYVQQNPQYQAYVQNQQIHQQLLLKQEQELAQLRLQNQIQQSQAHHRQLEQQQHRTHNSSWLPWAGSGTADDYNQLKAAKKQLEGQLQAAKEGYSKYRTRYFSLKEQYEVIQRERNEQGESIKQAQDAVFDIMKKSAHHAETDDKIRSAIESELLAPIDEWTKDFALSKELTGNEYVEVDFLELFSRIACKGVTPECLTKDPKLRQKQIPRYLAKAFLSYVVMLKVFDSPFFLVRGMNFGPDNKETTMLEQLELLRHYLIEANPKEGNKWRSQTVSAISELVAAYETGKGSHLLEICEKHATEFERSGARFILKERTEESHKALVAVFQKAGELALRLWRYPTDMGSVGSDLLNDRSFMYKSSEMEAHISHKLDDTSMDGSKVALVIFPGIRANGNQEGERYGESKVWLKAQVRLSKSSTARPSSAEVKEKAGKPPLPPNPRRTAEKSIGSRYMRG